MTRVARTMSVLVVAMASAIGCQESQTATTGINVQLSAGHYLAGRYEESIAAAQTVLAADPESAEAYNNLAIAYLALKRYDEGVGRRDQEPAGSAPPRPGVSARQEQSGVGPGRTGETPYGEALTLTS